MAESWVPFAQQLGLAAPLVALLLWLLGSNTSERRDITDKFLGAQQRQLEANTELQKIASGAQLQLAVALAEHSQTIREHTRVSTEEHRRMLELIQSIMNKA